jgi:hypothetical protein
MRLRLPILVALALLTLTPNPVAADSQQWTQYANPRFGTHADYPSARFKPQPPPENGDGQGFKAPDGAELIVFGRYNIDESTPASYETFLRSDDGGKYAGLTYRASGDGWLVLSGLRGGDIFYEKYLFKTEVIHGMVAIYPQALKAAYNPIVARIARSLGAGRVEIR